MSCWGPPAGLKSNNQRENGGCLKYGLESKYDKTDVSRITKEREIAYGNYAKFFGDAFKNIGFMPDYLSIQNECGYKAEWVSCQWHNHERGDKPNYYTAFDSVYNRLYNTYGENMPKMIACEAENLDVMEKTFKPWTYLWTGVPERKGKAHAYCYHIYNFDSNSDMNYVKQRLETLGNEMVECQIL